MNKNKIIGILFFILLIFLTISANIYFHWLSFDRLVANKEFLIAFSNNHRLMLALGMTLLYLLVVLLHIPGITALTLLCGALLGPLWGTICVVFSGSLGALIAFWIARYFLRDWVNAKFGHKLIQLNKGIEENGFNYLLFIRLFPIFPYIFVNMPAGLTSIKTKDYFWATLLGNIPVAAIYCYLSSTFWNIHSISEIISIKILFPLGLLAILALLPIIYKKLIAQLSVFKNRKIIN